MINGSTSYGYVRRRSRHDYGEKELLDLMTMYGEDLDMTVVTQWLFRH